MLTRSLSLIIITSHTLARVDLSGRRRLNITGCWQRPMLDAASPAALLATAIKLAPHKASRVWVLNSELATTQISLPLEVSVLLAEGELKHALALEAEGQTGIAATSSRIGSIPIRQLDDNSDAAVSDAAADADHYWVTQIADADIEAMQSAARGLGTELVAVAHPHCAAYQNGELNHESLLRLDAIPDLVEQWAQLLSDISHWSHASIDGAITIEAVRSQRNQVALQITACLLTASCLCGWAWHRSATLARLSSEITAFEKNNSDREEAAGLIKAADTRISRLRDEVTKLTQHQSELRRNLELADQTARLHQSNWCDLLDAIHAAAHEDCWIQCWRVEKEQVILSGLAIDQPAACRFVGRLDQKLQSSCWMVLPANTAQADQELVAFTIAIQPQSASAVSDTNANSIVFQFMERQLR